MEDNKQSQDRIIKEEITLGNDVDLRKVFLTEVKMQALYSEGEIKFVETSDAVN